LGSLRIPMLGVFPTIQTVLGQLAVAAVIALGIWWTRRSVAATPGSR